MLFVSCKTPLLSLYQQSKGTLFLSLTFMPFTKPRFDDDIEMKPVKSGLAAAIPFDPPRAREVRL